ncbi:SPOR domain-containing protein [Paracoccus tegillarcae]|nr:SPOR domain-containing protein [Paracoccus tegillarcae]
MAVMDFRDGGHVFSRGDKRREFSYRDNGEDGDAEGAPYAAEPAEPSLSVRLGRLTHYLGALVSVALMVGLMAWGWQLVMRDVSGVPVIKAVAGAARTTPDDPGGELTGHTGFAVNNVSGGAQDVPADQVGIAPAATALDDTDVAMGELGAAAHEPLAATDQALNFDGEAQIATQDSEVAAARAASEALAEAANLEALAEAAAAEAQVAAATVTDEPAEEGAITSVVTDETGNPTQTDAIREALEQAQETAATPAVARSARPAPRPRRVASVAPPAAAPAPVQAATAEADAAPARRPEAAQAAADADAQAPAPAPAPAQTAQVSSGAPLVQIGAFDSDSIAANEWGRLSGKFGNLFSGKGQVIQRHEVNGRTFWRLRVAGFETRAAAQDFCAKLKAGGTDCIPATAQ